MHLIARTLLTATVASIVTTGTAARLGRSNGAHPAAPINAVSRLLWGQRSFRHHDASFQYTAGGALVNFCGCLFWSSVMEMSEQRNPTRTLLAGLARGTLLSASSYLVDQIVLPPRWRPGYRRFLSARQVVAVYATLAAALPLRTWISTRVRARYSIFQ